MNLTYSTPKKRLKNSLRLFNLLRPMRIMSLNFFLVMVWQSWRLSSAWREINHLFRPNWGSKLSVNFSMKKHRKRVVILTIKLILLFLLCFFIEKLDVRVYIKLNSIGSKSFPRCVRGEPNSCVITIFSDTRDTSGGVEKWQ